MFNIIMTCIVMALTGVQVLNVGEVGIPISIAAYLAGACVGELIARLILKLGDKE